MNSLLLKRLATTAIAFLLLFYVGYQIYQSHYSDVKTETAVYFTASDSVQVSGVAIRNEILLNTQKTGGVVDYLLANGDKAAKGGTVALIFSDAQQAAAHREMESVNLEIKKLESLQSPGNTYAASPDSLDQQIHQELFSLLDQPASGDISQLSQSRENLVSLISEREIVTGEASNLGDRLKNLESQQTSLSQKAGNSLGTILSPASGYFISSTDGLESAVDFSGATGLTSDQIQSAEKLQPAPVSGCPGKINGSYNWYFACVVGADQAAAFRHLINDGTVQVRFPFVSNETVPASVVAVNQSGSESQAAVILSSDYMNAELAAIRQETAQIILREYTGIRVSSQSVHFVTVSREVPDGKGNHTTVKKNVSGVYVLHGNQLSFRQIVPLYSTDNYVVCDPNPPLGNLMTDQTVKLHDEVIVEGTDLYDGKVVQ